MDKLRTKKLSARQRQQRLHYLKGLFRLSFRTALSVSETIGDDDDYDSMTEFAFEGASAGDDEEMEEFRADFQAIDAEDVYIQLCIDYYQDVLTEMQYRQNLNQWDIDTKKAYADALSQVADRPHRVRRHGKYYNLPGYSDNSYTITPNGLRIRRRKDALKKPSYYYQRIDELTARITKSQQHQAEVEAKIAALQKELAQIKGVAMEPTNATVMANNTTDKANNVASKSHKLTKLALQQAVALTVTPELTKWQTLRRAL